MTSPAEDTSTLHYSENNNTTVSVRIGQQKEHNHNTASKDNNTTQDDSSTDGGGNTLREISVWLSTLQVVYNFTLLEYKRYLRIKYQFYIYQRTKRILFL